MAPGVSMGAKTWRMSSPQWERSVRAPVGDWVLTVIAWSGQVSRSAAISGRAACTSPTDAAWIQIPPMDAGSMRTKPSRSRSRSR